MRIRITLVWLTLDKELSVSLYSDTGTITIMEFERETKTESDSDSGKGRLPRRGVVLVADDDPAVRTMVRLLLEHDRNQVLEAADGMAAWRLIERDPPGVVVTDLKMPTMDGLTLCRRIKAAFGAIKVIIYTAGMTTSEESELAGCDRFFHKTDPISELQLAVRNCWIDAR